MRRRNRLPRFHEGVSAWVALVALAATVAAGAALAHAQADVRARTDGA